MNIEWLAEASDLNQKNKKSMAGVKNDKTSKRAA